MATELPETQTVIVRPVLFCAPVFWTQRYWAEVVHVWDDVRAEMPLDEKPTAELEVGLDATLGDTLSAALDAWGFAPGAEAQGMTEPIRDVRRFAFVKPGDEAGVSEQVGYSWPAELTIARSDGSVEEVPAVDVTYRELFVSSRLGLIEGDVTRPYVHPVLPQGDVHLVVEALKVGVEVIRAAYDALPAVTNDLVHVIRATAPEAHRLAHRAVDEGTKDYVLYKFGRWLWDKRPWNRSAARGLDSPSTSGPGMETTDRPGPPSRDLPPRNRTEEPPRRRDDGA